MSKNIELHEAIRHGDVEHLRRALSSGVDIEKKDQFGRAPLALAVDGSASEEMVKILLDAGCDIESADDAGFTPLLRAAFRGNGNLVNLLCDRGANIEAKSSGGLTPLMWSVYQDFRDVFRILIERGADCDAKDDLGDSVLQIASHEGRIEIVRDLMLLMEPDISMIRYSGNMSIKDWAEKESIGVILSTHERLTLNKATRRDRVDDIDFGI